RGPVPSSADRGQLAATAADPVADVLTRFRAAGSALTAGAGKIRGAPAGGAPYVACFYRSRSVCVFETALVLQVGRAVVGVVWAFAAARSGCRHGPGIREIPAGVLERGLHLQVGDFLRCSALVTRSSPGVLQVERVGHVRFEA